MRLNNDIRDKLCESVMNAFFPEEREKKLSEEASKAFMDMDWEPYRRARSLVEGYEEYNYLHEIVRLDSKYNCIYLHVESYRSETWVDIQETDGRLEIFFNSRDRLKCIDALTLKGGDVLKDRVDELIKFKNDEYLTKLYFKGFLAKCTTTADVTDVFPVLSPLVKGLEAPKDGEENSFDPDVINRALDKEDA